MDIRNLFFKSRSFTPIPILLMMLYFARPNSPYFFLGIVLIVIGEIIRLRSVSFAGGETRTMNVGASSICKSGPYSIVRNPLYIGNMMIYVGFAFVAGSVYVVTISSITFIYFFIQYRRPCRRRRPCNSSTGRRPGTGRPCPCAIMGWRSRCPCARRRASTSSLMVHCGCG